MSGANPFAALVNVNVDHRSILSDVFEYIFGFTLNPQKTKDLLYLKDVHEVQGKTELEFSNLHYALFERLFLCNKESELYSNRQNTHARQTSVVKYLYECYENLAAKKGHFTSEQENSLKHEIIQNIATAIVQPEMFSGQEIALDALNLIKANLPDAFEFFLDIVQQVHQLDSTNESVRNFMEEISLIIVAHVTKADLVSLDQSVFRYLEAVFRNEFTGELFIDTCFPTRQAPGSQFNETAIGAVLNVSVLPSSHNRGYSFFRDSFNETAPANLGAIDEAMWLYTNQISEQMHSVILSAMKCGPKVKSKVLLWMADCLHRNRHRRQVWDAEVPEYNPFIYTSATDGFMLNLGNLLLKLCRPFCNGEKILRVDPTYCAVPNERRREKDVSMMDMSTETCLLPATSTDGTEEERPMADRYSFITECFYLTHRAIELGYKVVIDKLTKKNHDLVHTYTIFEEARTQNDIEQIEILGDSLAEMRTQFYSLKCALSDQALVRQMFDLMSGTCMWLCQVALHHDFKDTTSYAPLTKLKLHVPLPDEVPITLKCIPEYIVENLVSFLVFARRFNTASLEIQGYYKLSPIFSFILAYMGSQRHMTNPHLRASVAEGLESLLPQHSPNDDFESNVERTRLFSEHPHRLQIASSLMEVFVGIEMTGQEAFEQKFNYRRPLYMIFNFLWDLPEQVECFRSSARDAESNMEATHPPLFLKFANLLINDAIFLLDEALANMALLKEMQQAKDNGDWTHLNGAERSQNMNAMRQIESIARFDNLLGKYTICTLEKLTSEISIVFTHSTMVDRIASMLNYFLNNLVGPNQKNFKVKNSEKYAFRPSETVMDICKIYVNLKDIDAFCLAVSRDGRSYRPVLFQLAEDVLVKIGGGNLIGALKEVADKVAVNAKTNRATEEAMVGAPEHFLDPIMSSVMLDPVILPSSRQTVDRSTIARHLLSDQTDPFNRSALSMDQVIPNVELAEEIKRWKQNRNIS